MWRIPSSGSSMTKEHRKPTRQQAVMLGAIHSIFKPCPSGRQSLVMLWRIGRAFKPAQLSCLAYNKTRSFTFTTRRFITMSDKPITAYKASVDLPPQTQKLPGLDKDMAVPAEHTKLEYWDDEGKPYLKEYVGTGKLEGKKVIVTGGDSGIGRTVAIFFAREGADVTIVHLPEEEADAKAVEAEITKNSSSKVLLIPLDLTTPGAAKKVVSSHLKKFGKLDILVNNASKQIMSSSIEELKDETILSTFQSNIFQMMQLARESVPHMKRGSAIINTSSVVAYKGSPGLLDCSATKGAIATFTRSLATELAAKGIRVNAVAPGLFYTPLQPASREAKEMEGWGVGTVPLHGRAGQPAEIGEAYVLLAGPGGNYMTGTVIHVNGGVHIGGA
ncbi:hypothetical protein C8R43DRAFT_1003988 [Mycena crocata]|nr:hypothetical protein C8R43DRAFT_1003988 [Mycena crocata]